jgi:hypothetical protein
VNLRKRSTKHSSYSMDDFSCDVFFMAVLFIYCCAFVTGWFCREIYVRFGCTCYNSSKFTLNTYLRLSSKRFHCCLLYLITFCCFAL